MPFQDARCWVTGLGISLSILLLISSRKNKREIGDVRGSRWRDGEISEEIETQDNERRQTGRGGWGNTGRSQAVGGKPAIEQCFSKCEPQTSNSSIPCELARNVTSQASAQK